MGYWEEIQKENKRNKRIAKDFDKSGVTKASLTQLGGGALAGGGALFFSKINKGIFHPTKLSAAAIGIGVGISALGTINSFKARKKLGREAKGEYSPYLAAIANPLAGAILGGYAGVAGILAVNKLAKVSRSAKVARDARKASSIKKAIGGAITPEIMTKGKMVWRRVRGRIIPIRMKNV